MSNIIRRLINEKAELQAAFDRLQQERDDLLWKVFGFENGEVYYRLQKENERLLWENDDLREALYDCYGSCCRDECVCDLAAESGR